MFVANDDLSIYCTRGDCCEFPVTHQFKQGGVVRFKVFRKKDCASVVLQRDFVVESETDTITIALTGDDTKIGEVISKPTDYWYEVELNPDTNPQTIIGYDEDGAKVFKLFPEGKDVDAEDIEVVGKKTLQELVDYALEQAKESGEFDGEKGDAFTYDDFTEEQLASLKGEKGDQGGTGVYVGETEPTDPTVSVWVNPNGDEVAEMVLTKPQTLTEAQKDQARENIGVIEYYNAAREDLGVTLGIDGATADNVTSERIFDLYDALMAQYPDKVQKKEVHNDDGSFTNYEYVISTGDYNEVVGSFNAKDDNVKKPKYLVLSGIHGYEKTAVVSTYRLFRDIVAGYNIPAHFKENCVVHFLPVGNPYSLDNNIRFNANGVDINRNFDWNWGVNVADGKNPGTAPASEQETQAVANWLNANKDAELLLDCHNMSPAKNEIVTIVGLADSEEHNKWKKIAMRGIDRVVPYWKNVIGYSNQTIFRNSASLNEGGCAAFYASEVLRIPSLSLEMSVFPTGTETARDEMGAETIAVAAEVIGNALLEFYKQYEVVDMTEVNEKLDSIFAQVNSGFRIESGNLHLAVDASDNTLKIPCTSGAKILAVAPDEETYDDIAWARNEDGTLAEPLAHAQGPVFVGAIGQMLTKLPYSAQYDSSGKVEKLQYMGYASVIKSLSTSNTKQIPNYHYCYCNNEDGFTIQCPGIKAGTYNWTAYYWND